MHTVPKFSQSEAKSDATRQPNNGTSSSSNLSLECLFQFASNHDKKYPPLQPVESIDDNEFPILAKMMQSEGVLHPSVCRDDQCIRDVIKSGTYADNIFVLNGDKK